MKTEEGTDPFDRLYKVWAEHAMRRRTDPPSRERWDLTVLFLLMSKDPNRMRRYAYIESPQPESLGADAYELWQQMPEYTVNRSAPCRTLEELGHYEVAHRWHMKRLMYERGMGERYEEIVTAQEEHERAYKARARRGQTSVLTIGCAGMALLAFMILTVLLIIAIKMSG